MKLKDWASFFSLFFRSLYVKFTSHELRNKEKSTGCTHRYTNCMFKNTFTEHSKYLVNKALDHFDDISLRERFVSFFFDK